MKVTDRIDVLPELSHTFLAVKECEKSKPAALEFFRRTRRLNMGHRVVVFRKDHPDIVLLRVRQGVEVYFL